MKLVPGKLYKTKCRIPFVKEDFRNTGSVVLEKEMKPGSVVMFLETREVAPGGYTEHVFLVGIQRMVSREQSVDVKEEQFLEEVEL